MSNKGVLWSGLIFLFMLVGQGYAQGGPPACAELTSIPPYVGGGELWVKIDHSLCPVPDGMPGISSSVSRYRPATETTAQVFGLFHPMTVFFLLVSATAM